MFFGLDDLPVRIFFYFRKTKTDLGMATCSFFHLYQTIMDGAHSSQKPRWLGIYRVQDLINKTRYSLINIDQKTTATIDLFTNNKLQAEQLKPLNISQEHFILPSPFDENETVIPLYYYNYIEGLEKENLEYNSKIINGYQIIGSVYAKAGELSNNKDTIHTNLGNILDNLEEIENFIQNFLISLENRWIAYKNLLFPSFKRFFLFLFSFLFFISFSILICFFLLTYIGKTSILKYLSCFIWTSFSFIITFAFLIGGFLGTARIVVQDGSKMVKFVLSSENLLDDNSIFISNVNKTFLDVCLNREGNLSQVIGIYDDGSIMMEIDAFYKKKEVVSRLIESSKTFFPFSSVNEVETNLSLYTLNFSSTYPGIDKLMSKINRQLENELLVDNIGNCPFGWKYLSNLKEFMKNASFKKCIIFPDWTIEDIQKKYENETFLQELIQLKIYQQASDQLIREINSLGKEYKERLQTIYESFIDDLRTSKALIDSLYLLYFPFVGQKSVFSILECGEIKQYLEFFFHQIEININDDFPKLSSILFSIGILGLFGIQLTYLTISTNKKYKSIKKDKSYYDSLPRINQIGENYKFE